MPSSFLYILFLLCSTSVPAFSSPLCDETAGGREKERRGRKKKERAFYSTLSLPVVSLAFTVFVYHLSEIASFAVSVVCSPLSYVLLAHRRRVPHACSRSVVLVLPPYSGLVACRTVPAGRGGERGKDRRGPAAAAPPRAS